MFQQPLPTSLSEKPLTYATMAVAFEAKLITEQDFSPSVCHQQDNALEPLT